MLGASIEGRDVCLRAAARLSVYAFRGPSAKMGKIFKIYLCGDRVYSCSTCRTHLAKHDQIVSKVPRAGSRLHGARELAA